MTRQQLYCDLPPELHEADDILDRYGRWARGGGGGGARCGSAEGMYRAPQDDEDRKPSEPVMQPLEVERVKSSLTQLPMMTLLVISWLYIDVGALQSKMRKHGIQPRHMRERHLEGVRLFWRAWLGFAPMTKRTVAIRSVVVENCDT